MLVRVKINDTPSSLERTHNLLWENFWPPSPFLENLGERVWIGGGGVSPEKSSQVTPVILHSANNPSQKEQPKIEQPKRTEYHLHHFNTTPADWHFICSAFLLLEPRLIFLKVSKVWTDSSIIVIKHTPVPVDISNSYRSMTAKKCKNTLGFKQN